MDDGCLRGVRVFHLFRGEVAHGHTEARRHKGTEARSPDVIQGWWTDQRTAGLRPSNQSPTLESVGHPHPLAILLVAHNAEQTSLEAMSAFRAAIVVRQTAEDVTTPWTGLLTSRPSTTRRLGGSEAVDKNDGPGDAPDLNEALCLVPQCCPVSWTLVPEAERAVRKARFFKSRTQRSQQPTDCCKRCPREKHNPPAAPAHPSAHRHQGDGGEGPKLTEHLAHQSTSSAIRSSTRQRNTSSALAERVSRDVCTTTRYTVQLLADGGLTMATYEPRCPSGGL